MSNFIEHIYLLLLLLENSHKYLNNQSLWRQLVAKNIPKDRDATPDTQTVSTHDLSIPIRRITPSREWRARLDDGKRMKAEELCDVVYAMAREGATMDLIAAYYGLDRRELGRVAGDAWNMANAELVLEIFRDQIMTALYSKQVLAKIYVGKQFAGQRDAEPLSADVSQADGVGGLTINLNVTKANRDEQGKTQTVGESAGSVGAAIDSGGTQTSTIADEVSNSSVVVNP